MVQDVVKISIQPDSLVVISVKSAAQKAGNCERARPLLLLVLHSPMRLAVGRAGYHQQGLLDPVPGVASSKLYCKMLVSKLL